MKSTIPFELKPEHIRLAAELNFTLDLESEYDDPYLPTINRKRPFGNSGAVYSACEVLEYDRDEEGYFSKKDMDKAEDLLIELPVAVKIMLQNQTFEPGIYEINRFDSGCHTCRMGKNYKKLRPVLEQLRQQFPESPQVENLTHRCMGIMEDDPFSVILSDLGYMKSCPVFNTAIQLFKQARLTKTTVILT